MNVTPRLTDHARERCAQMGISTKVAKRIWRNWSVRYEPDDQESECVIVTSTLEPSYAVVVDDSHAVPVIVTVLFNEKNTYIREGASYRLSTKGAS